MRLHILPIIIPLALFGSAVAEEKAVVLLSDQQLERIAAGSTDYEPGAGIGSGGAIVGNSSSATLTTSGDVQVNDGVQQGVRAVNLVNSAESGVANGVNVWDGRIESQSAATQLDVEQNNSIVQDQSRRASLPNYVRTDANVERTSTQSSETTHSGMVDTEQVILGQQIQGGIGVSIAGEVDADLSGGSIALSNHVAGSFSGTVEGSGGLFGNISTSGTTTVTAETDQTLDWVLPDLTLSLRGAGCYVEIGSCDSSGSYANSTSEMVNSYSPFTLENAEAEYVVVDGSTLNATSSYTVALGGSAQGAVNAVNLVNSAGSVVANSVNVSRTPTVGPGLNLSQVNTVVQRR